MHQFYRRVTVSEKSCLGIELIVTAAKYAVTLAMLYPMCCGGVASRALLVAGSQVQKLTCLNVLQLVMLMRWVLHRVIAPRGNLVLATVDGPGVAATGFRYLKPKRCIRDDIDPRARWPLRRADTKLKFARNGVKFASRCFNRRGCRQRMRWG